MAANVVTKVTTKAVQRCYESGHQSEYEKNDKVATRLDPRVRKSVTGRGMINLRSKSTAIVAKRAEVAVRTKAQTGVTVTVLRKREGRQSGYQYDDKKGTRMNI